MIDVLTYSKDRTKFIQILKDKGSKRVSEDGKFLWNKTKTKKESNHSVSLCRCRDQEELDELLAMEELEVLGTYEDVFSTPALKAKYDQAYPRNPKTYTDEEGAERTYIAPEKIGEFA